ncbi:hypothetical protein P0136_06870 [Lentisphaerota bacterium ZTH]|nr:hypothetical protein JYG24_02020 [Lentisphaerota bacterium]WET07710.1 hypothetical protein P0136_06870 [Lentisphaerota bacterium ZTH]
MKLFAIAAGLSGLFGVVTANAFDNFSEAFNLAQSRYNQGHFLRSAEFSQRAFGLAADNKQKYNALLLQGEALMAGRDFEKAAMIFADAEKIKGISVEQQISAFSGRLRSQYLAHDYSALGKLCSEVLAEKSISRQHLRLAAFYGCLAARQIGDYRNEILTADKLYNSESATSAWKARAVLFKLQALCDMKKYSQAATLVSSVQKLDVPLPMLSEWYVRCGFCEEKNGDLEKAVDFYQKAQQYDHGYYRGLAFLRAGILAAKKPATAELAMQDFDKVIKSESHPLHKIQAVYRWGELLDKQKKYKEALAVLKLEEKIKCSSMWRAEIFRLEGTIYHQQGQLARAEYFLIASLEQPGCPLKCKLAATGLLNQIKRERKHIEDRKTITENSAQS